MLVDGQRHAPAVLPPGRIPFTHCRGDWIRYGYDTGCMVAATENGAPNRPTRSELLYRLSYPGPLRQTGV